MERLPTGSDAEPAPPVDTGTSHRHNQQIKLSELRGSGRVLLESIREGDGDTDVKEGETET